MCQNLAMTGSISHDCKVGFVGMMDQTVAAAIKAGIENVIVQESTENDFKAFQLKSNKV